MTLYRVLVETYAPPIWRPQFGPRPKNWRRHDVIVLAFDEREARRIALADFDAYRKRRVVKDSIVPVAIDYPRVVMQQEVTW